MIQAWNHLHEEATQEQNQKIISKIFSFSHNEKLKAMEEKIKEESVKMQLEKRNEIAMRRE